MKFKPFNIEAVEEIRPYIDNCPYLNSDFSRGFLFMWRERMETHYCIEDETFVIRYTINQQPVFTYPYGKNVGKMLKRLVDYVSEQNYPLSFYDLNEEQMHRIQVSGDYHGLTLSYDDKWSDYIYNFEEVLTFSGKKYSGQRNHINKFNKLYGPPQVRSLDEVSKEKVEEMLLKYRQEHEDNTSLEQEEYNRTIELLENYQALDQHGIVLMDGDEVIALAIGELVGRMLVIHVEKALRRYEGIYPTTYQSFVRWIDANFGRREIVNREDDSGDPGLRKSKQQYQPIGQVHKYMVHINSPLQEMDWNPVIGDKIYLTRFYDRDREDYYQLNIDDENNRYWGYDYRQDESFDEITVDSFYDSAVSDMMIGDSINLAIREKGNTRMIGEIIFWNFSYNLDTEIGCRLLPQYQGHGYGQEAFEMAVRYAREVLHFNPWARCYKANEASVRMIEKAGLILEREDGEFYYFK